MKERTTISLDADVSSWEERERILYERQLHSFLNQRQRIISIGQSLESRQDLGMSKARKFYCKCMIALLGSAIRILLRELKRSLSKSLKHRCQ